MSPATTLASFPEELLERILALCVIAPLYPLARPAWHSNQHNPSSQYQPRTAKASSSTRGRLAPLLVCKAFNRIATPLFYHTLHLSSQAQLWTLLNCALYPNPALAWYVRRVVLSGVWAEGGDLLRMCGGVRVLDVTLDLSGPHQITQSKDADAKSFCRGLAHSTAVTHLTIRKPSNVYLTQSKPRYVLCGMAKAIQNWAHLESAHLAFRLSDDNIASPFASLKAAQPGPITLLTHALRSSPKLHTFCTLVPSLWNEAILRVSENPRLERIVLGDGNVEGGAEQLASGIVGTGLFLMQARKHARLSDLIRAGTPIIRSRAHTMGTVAPSYPTSASPSPCPPMRKGVSAGNAPSTSSSASTCYPSAPSPPSSSHRFPSSVEWSHDAYRRHPHHHHNGSRSSSRSRLLSSPAQ